MSAIAKHEQNLPAPAASESAAIFQIIERAARDPNVDIDKMQRLMDLREREMNRIAQQQFNEAMKAAQSEMPQVVRNATNDQTRSKYAKYETISEAIQPIIAKHGFSLSFNEGTTDKQNCIRILCDVMHEGGHTKQYHADIPLDAVGMKGNANKTATHAYGSTKSYGRRYLKMDIFDVAVKDEDDDGNAAGDAYEAITAEQRQELQELIEKAGGEVPTFCTWAKIDSLAALASRNFEKAKQALEAKIRQKGAAK